MRIAIIGCGYVGTALASSLASRGCDVVGTTTRTDRCRQLNELGIRGHVLELAQTHELRALLQDRQAVVVTVAPNHPAATHERVYLQGVRHLLQATASGTAVRHILYTSSTSVYGQSDGSWVTEDSPTEPATDNGRILVRAERELAAGAAGLGMAAAILRLAGIIGPDRGPAKRIVQYAGEKRTDGDGYVNLIHRDDITAASTALLERCYAGTLNLSDGRPVRRRDLYDRLMTAAGLSPIRWVRPAGDADLGKRVSNQRIVELLGLATRDAAAESVRDLAERQRTLRPQP